MVERGDYNIWEVVGETLRSMTYVDDTLEDATPIVETPEEDPEPL